ncbi:hypothetical protein A4G19_11945 [Pasteurellaceae bacterium Macca]|nr:hypothetical protein [Pasteurellaceae bacterium Macca]
MSTQIQFQSFCFKSSQVRVVTDPNQEYWFCGKDVCDILGYTNDSKALKDHCKEKGVTKRYSLTEGGKQELTFINEPNLYRLIIKSRKPEAEPFEAWVFEEVLPQIRKTGQYSQNLPENRPLVEAEEEALQIIVSLYHSLNGGHEMASKIFTQDYQWLARDIDKHIGGHYLYNLHRPAENALDKAKKYIQAKSERISFVRGMLSLLDGLPSH